jgi:hypothetical protein
MAKPVQAAQPTFSLEMLRQIVATPEARELFTAMMREAGHSAKVADTTEAMDRTVIAAFKRAGFGTVVPRVDTMTYGRWIAAGYRVKPGEHAVKCKNLRLFCRSQVEEITKREQAELLAEREARKAAKTSDRLPAVSPETEAPKPCLWR